MLARGPMGAGVVTSCPCSSSRNLLRACSVFPHSWGMLRVTGCWACLPQVPPLGRGDRGLGEEAGMSVEGPRGSEGEGFYTETCRHALASFNDCFSSALCPGNPVQDSTSICYLKKKKFGRHCSPLLGGNTESGAGSSHSPKSRDVSGAELAQGSVCLRALGADCHLQRPPAQTRTGWQGAGGWGGVLSSVQESAVTTAVSPLSRGPPAAVGGRVPSQWEPGAPLPRPLPGEGEGGSQWHRGDNSSHAVWVQPGDPWRGG